MADDIIQLVVDGPGKKVDTESLVVGINTVHRERHEIAGAGDVEIARVLDTDPAASDYGLLIRTPALVSPQTSTGSVATVAPDATGSVDSNQIASGKTGKLLAFEACGSVAFKVELQTVLNGSATTRLVKFGRSGDVAWISPHKDLIQQVESATAGFDGFRLLFTNLDTGSQGSDFYATFLWDEV